MDLETAAAATDGILAVVTAALTGDGLLSGNAFFHEIQIAANVLFFAAARRLPAE